MSRRMDSAVTLFPEPLSPTSPKVSPRAIARLTPLMACTTPSSVKKWVRRSRISSSTSRMRTHFPPRQYGGGAAHGSLGIHSSLPLRGQRVSGGHFHFHPTPSLTGALPPPNWRG